MPHRDSSGSASVAAQDGYATRGSPTEAVSTSLWGMVIGIILTVVLVGLVAGDVALVRMLGRKRNGPR
jgi:uncharacterized membrane protein